VIVADDGVTGARRSLTRGIAVAPGECGGSALESVCSLNTSYDCEKTHFSHIRGTSSLPHHSMEHKWCTSALLHASHGSGGNV